MACIYLLHSRGGPQRFNFDITYFLPYYSYPLLEDTQFILLDVMHPESHRVTLVHNKSEHEAIIPQVIKIFLRVKQQFND